MGFTGKQFQAGLKFPAGLTFFKNYLTAIKCSLHANFSLGSPKFTFTSTSGSFTITSAGYQATTANDEVLKYLIANNRTAAQETIVIKFTPTGDFANDGVARRILSNDTKVRDIQKVSSRNDIAVYPNVTDDVGCVFISSTIPLNGITYVLCAVFYGPSESTNGRLYVNTTPESLTTTNYTTNEWSGSFYIGCKYDGTNQLNGVISSIAFFNRSITASEILALNGLM